jgi:imidazolonepropionase-like amidohydrolase
LRRNSLRISAIFLLFVAAELLLSQTPQSRPLLIRHVNVIDVFEGGIKRDVSISIRGALLDRIATDLEAEPGATVIDGSGKFVIPGLWDMHVHLREAEPSFRTLIENGITSVRAMYSGLPLSEYEKWRALPDAVRIAAAGFVNGPASADDARLTVKLAAANRADFIEVSNKLSREAYFAVADETRRLGTNFAGPVLNSITLAEAAAAGQLSIERPFDRLPVRSRAQLFETFADSGTFLTPMLRASKYRGAFVRSAQNAGVHLLAGSDAGAESGLPLGTSLHDELELLVKEGLTPVQALQAATRNPALYFGTLTLMGTIEKGKAADLVLLDSNPLDDIRNARKINAVVMRGKYYSAPALRSPEKSR